MFDEKMKSMWEKAITFHGHACPGLAVGCRMVYEAINELELKERSGDEEIVCVTETDACCVDAAQVLLGCTLGKGNLFLKLRGKTAMSFFDRGTGRGCRILWTGGGDDGLSREAKMELVLSSEGRTCFVLETLPSGPPPEALISRSVSCAKCGEMTSEGMVVHHEGRPYCLDCRPHHPRVF